MLLKRILIVFFVFMVGTSALMFFLRPESRNLSSLNESNWKESRLNIEDFVLFSYSGNVLDGRWTGRLASFIEPNMLELYGEVRGTKYTDEKVQNFSTESAVAYFDSPSLSSMSGEAKLLRVEAKSFVEFSTGDLFFETDYAEFDAVQNTLQSSRSIKVYGKNQEFYGDEGFRFDLETEKLDVLGKVHGMFRNPPESLR